MKQFLLFLVALLVLAKVSSAADATSTPTSPPVAAAPLRFCLATLEHDHAWWTMDHIRQTPGVEFAGYYDLQAKELRKMLDDHGLVCCGTHTPLETIQPENLATTIEFNHVLGNKYLIVPWMDLKTKEAWLAKAKQFTEQVPKVKAASMVLGYHGYQGKLYDGISGWDLFFGNTPPDVAMQIDTSSCVLYKVDPVEVVKKYPGRSRTIHLKECGGPQFAAIGEGDVNFKALLDACEKVGGIEWYIVEDERGGNALDTVRRCYEGMKKLGRA